MYIVLTSVHNDADNTDDADDYNRVIGIAQLKTTKLKNLKFQVKNIFLSKHYQIIDMGTCTSICMCTCTYVEMCLCMYLRIIMEFFLPNTIPLFPELWNLSSFPEFHYHNGISFSPLWQAFLYANVKLLIQCNSMTVA